MIFRREDPEAWPLGPHLFERIAKFCKEYDSDSVPELIVQALVEDFALGAGKLVAVALVVDGRVAGHILVTMEEWGGKLYATIIQFELDVPLPREERLAWARWLEDWARARGAVAMQALARTRALARAFRAYGFEEKRILLRKPLAPGGDQQGQPGPL